MSADLLREAAALMRERAEAATSIYSPGHIKAGEVVPWFSESEALDFDVNDGPHIAGMSPAVALVVADWLDDQLAAFLEGRPGNYLSTQRAVAVARAYLGT